MLRFVSSGLGSALALAVLVTAADALAIDPFEIQVYDGTSNAPGAPGLELHLNRVFNGLKTATPPELPQNHVTHMTLEPSIGVTPILELGGYFQTALRADGTFDYGGVKLRAKLVTPKHWREHLRLGLNLELSLVPEHYERSRWGGEVRPIVAWENEHWLFAVNPIVSVPLGPPDASGGPTFEPAAMAKWKIAGAVGVGFEYYASFGRFSAPDRLQAELHYLYEAVDLLSIPHWEFNFGIGEGLTSASNGVVAKVVLGYSWESDAPKDRAPLALRRGSVAFDR